MFSKPQRGMTLLETLLVLLVAGSILIFSIRQYQNYRLDADIQLVKYNVDTIFEAMAGYHKVNCYGRTDPAFSNQVPHGQIVPGALNPDNPLAANPPVSIDIEADLAKNGFWPLNIAKATPPNPQPPLIPESPLVDSTGPGLNGYIAQFNQYTSSRQICTEPASAAPVINPTDTTQCSNASTVGTILLWKVQVAILLADSRLGTDPTLAESYLSLFGGDCLSSYDAAKKVVTPCNQVTPGGTGANYVVWERLPSLASPYSQSGYSITNATVQQFTQMYTTYPMLYLLSPVSGGNIPNGTPQYIYCGG